jgi:hypothetical protein
MSLILSKVRAGVWKNGEVANGSVAEPDEEFDEVLENGDRIILTNSELDESRALAFVRDAGAGATVLFVGTTRNEFEGKQK